MKLIIVSLLFLILSLSMPLKAYEIEEISVQPINYSIHRTGKLDFKRTLNLSFKSSGYLHKLTVDEGDYFQKNQLLALLDTAELKAAKNAAYAQLLQAKREVQRIKKLLKQKVSSENELDIAKTKLETIRSEYQVALYTLEKSKINAPFSGVVLTKNAELGELMSPGKEVLKVATLKNNWVVKVALTGVEVSQIHLHQKVKVKLHALGTIEGVIDKIPAISNTTGNLFIIDVLLPNLVMSKGIAAGQIAEVTIEITSDDFVYQLPIKALMAVDDEGKALVAVNQASKIRSKNENTFNQQRFDILKLDNQYVYLAANNTDQPIKIVVNGWQRLSSNGQ